MQFGPDARQDLSEIFTRFFSERDESYHRFIHLILSIPYEFVYTNSIISIQPTLPTVRHSPHILASDKDCMSPWRSSRWSTVNTPRPRRRRKHWLQHNALLIWQGQVDLCRQWGLEDESAGSAPSLENSFSGKWHHDEMVAAARYGRFKGLKCA